MSDEAQGGSGKTANGELPQDLLELAKRQAQSVLDRLPMLGPILWLYLHSPAHKHIFVADLEWLVVPAVVLDQYKLYMKDNAPLAFASWAFVSEEVENRLAQGQMRLAPKDWKSGDRLWLIDLVAPFGGGKEVFRELREGVFAGRGIKQLLPRPDGKGVQAVEWKALEKKQAT